METLSVREERNKLCTTLLTKFAAVYCNQGYLTTIFVFQGQDSLFMFCGSDLNHGVTGERLEKRGQDLSSAQRPEFLFHQLFLADRKTARPSFAAASKANSN